MKLKEKFIKCKNKYDEYYILPVVDDAEQLVKIADDFAIGFAEWTWNKELITVNDCGYFEYKFNLYTRKKLLEMYKKEKGL
jgi:hypothetical protein